jgi:hypothetical protein
MKAICSSETSVSLELHGVTSQKAILLKKKVPLEEITPEKLLLLLLYVWVRDQVQIIHQRFFRNENIQATKTMSAEPSYTV